MDPSATATAVAVADQIFEAADRDANGLLTKSEIKKQLSKHPDLKEALLRGEGYAAMFGELDANHDGSIAPGEWREFYSKRLLTVGT